MGAICSKKSAFSGQRGQTLGSSMPIDNSRRPPPPHQQLLPQQQQQQHNPPPPRQQQQQQRHHPSPQAAEARRGQAAAAAEQRMKAQNKRGVNAANPNSGRLAAQLEAARSAPIAPEPSRREDTLIDDWRN